MKSFVLLTNYERDKDLKITNMVLDYLEEHGCKCCLPPYVPGDDDNDDNIEHYDLSEVPDDVECALTLGGDGTLLLAARNMYWRGIPVMGINLGHMGFLTSVETNALPDCLDKLISDDYYIDERMMIKGKVFREGRQLMRDVALNDIVVARSGYSHVVQYKVYINNELTGVYDADGIIVSTPTGATGYNLSAGGPILFPGTEVMVITPICPHSLQARSMVISHDSEVVIEIGDRHKSLKEGSIVTFDGIASVKLEAADRILITIAKKKTGLIRLKDNSFYQILRNKIGD